MSLFSSFLSPCIYVIFHVRYKTKTMRLLAKHFQCLFYVFIVCNSSRTESVLNCI